MRESFIEYFILRANCLPWCGHEIGELIISRAALRKTKLLHSIPKELRRRFKDLSMFRGIPVYMTKERAPVFLISRRDTTEKQDWLTDWLEDRTDWKAIIEREKTRARLPGRSLKE